MISKEIQDYVIGQIQDAASSGRFQLTGIPRHVHNGIDSPKVSQDNILPGIELSGTITFAQSTTYQIGVNFNASEVRFYGNAVRRDYIFTVTAANATAGDTYTNNGATFTVLHTITAGTTLVTVGTGAPTASGTLTKATGSGDATITFASSTHSIEVRANVTGSAKLGAGFAFQPLTTTSVQVGTKQYPFVQQIQITDATKSIVTNYLQGSAFFLVDSSATTPVVRAIADGFHIVEVEYAIDYGTQITGVVARATIVGVNQNYISVQVFLATGWEIDGLWVVN